MLRKHTLACICVAILGGGAQGAFAADATVESVDVIATGRVHQALFTIAFDGSNGVAVGTGGDIRETGDAGKTWRMVKAPVPAALFGVSIHGNRAIAVGQKGAIFVRGGNGPWSAVQSGSTERLLAVDMNANTAIAVGSFGALLRSTDGGIHWESAAPTWQDYSSDGADPNLYAVHVADNGTATVAGEFGIVAQSTDDGVTWQSRHKGAATLFGLDINAAGTGYAVGQDGVVIRTGDGGTTWTDVDAGVKENLLAVGVAADGTIYATGMHEINVGRDDGKPWRQLGGATAQGLWHSGLAPVPGSNAVIGVGQAAQILRLGK